MTHFRAVAGLAVASTLCAAAATASAQMSRVGLLLGEIQLLAAAGPSAHPRERPTTEAHKAIDAPLDLMAVCTPYAELFLNIGGHLSQHGGGSTTWVVSGPDCSQSFTFASGAAQLDIVGGINRFTECTGVTASQIPVMGGLLSHIRLSTLARGPEAFLSVEQTEGQFPLVCEDITPPPPIQHVFALSDFGAVAGDLDCDRIVGPIDLQALLAAWGGVGGPADLDHDGDIDGTDLAQLLASWGQGGG